MSPFNKDISFISHKTEHGGTPMIISGIILTALGDKGQVLVAKHRNGSVGNVQLFYVDKFSSISNLEKMHTQT